MAWFAALQVQDLAKTILRGKESVMEWTNAQGNAERCIPDASTIPRGNSLRDRWPVDMATKAWVL